MAPLSPAETDLATSTAIHDLGSAFMLAVETAARGREHGYENPFAFYFAGRGGVLGEVDAAVVYAAFGWFAPDRVTPLWQEGIAVAGAHEAARCYFEAAAAWGRDHLSEVGALDEFVPLAEAVVDAAETSGRPLFAGWKAQPRAGDAAGRAMQLVHVLREWRGANHLVATTASGLTPLEAILARDGERTARFFGWTGPFAPATEDQRARRARAEALTDELCAPTFEALGPAERARFVETVTALFAAGPRPERSGTR